MSACGPSARAAGNTTTTRTGAHPSGPHEGSTPAEARHELVAGFFASMQWLLLAAPNPDSPNDYSLAHGSGERVWVNLLRRLRYDRLVLPRGTLRGPRPHGVHGLLARLPRQVLSGEAHTDLQRGTNGHRGCCLLDWRGKATARALCRHRKRRLCGNDRRIAQCREVHPATSAIVIERLVCRQAIGAGARCFGHARDYNRIV